MRSSENPPPPPPLPDDYLEQAKAMILAGDAPPAHWVPHIKRLNFSLEKLAALTALESLYLSDTQVSDIAPLSAIAGLTVYVESDVRAKALRPTLARGSTVTVKVLK